MINGVSSLPVQHNYSSPVTASPQATTGQTKKQSGELSDEEQQVVREMQAIDRKVRAHEAAHQAAAAGIAVSGATFGYSRGPDGRMYATSGEVSIDASPVKGDPEATIRKALQVASAAMAPAEPSSQDRAVAAAAAMMANQARVEMSKEMQQYFDVASGGGEKQQGGMLDIFA